VSGIGQAIVLELARWHASIVIDYVCHPEAIDALEQQVRKLGDQSIGVEADVSKLADLRMLVDRAVSKFGRVDIMVNNAGVETRTSVLDTTEDQYEKVMAINLKSAFFGTQIAAKKIRAPWRRRSMSEQCTTPPSLRSWTRRYRWGEWRARRRSPASSALSPERVRAILQRRPSSPMAASCTAASVCSEGLRS